MSVTQSSFGTAQGQAVDLYTLTNSKGVIAKVTNFGGILTELHVPDRTGKLANITTGFDTLAPYLGSHPYFGATIGRVANRIANAQFPLDGKIYKLTVNDGPHSLHGGTNGWSKKVWKAEAHDGPTGPSLTLTLTSPDGDEGFPGTMKVTVIYTLTETNELRIDYHATTDAPTIINMTNHAYFNLAGVGSGKIYDHVLMIPADRYTPADATLIPTGELKSVKGTPFDFTAPTAIGARIRQTTDGMTGDVKVGYDHNFVLSAGGKGLTLAARVSEPTSGRIMEIETTEPGIQLYTGNFLDGSVKGFGGAYQQHDAFCLETQHFPDSIHHAHFPSTVLRPGQEYRSTTIHRFLAK